MPQSNYLIATDIISSQQSETLKKWITNHEFEEYESPKYKLSYNRHVQRNKLYMFMLSDIRHPVIMKVSCVRKSYKWKRRLQLILKHHQWDTNLTAFRCCLKAYSCNLAAPKPLAYWQKSDSRTRVKSYFLYQYVEADHTWSKLYKTLKKVKDKDSKLKRDLIDRKIINALKYLHKAGIRHGDIVSRNILMSVQSPEHLADARVCFIDYDGGTHTKIKHPAFIKRFFDLRDLRKFKIVSPYHMLKLYLGDDYHPLWRVVLTFWRWGGFNFFQWRNPKIRAARKHTR